MLEKEIEKTLRIKVKARGGICFKFVSPGINGVPDRMVLLKDRKFAFIELKSPGGKLRPLQEKRKRQLEALGFLVFKIDNKEQIEEVLNEIQSV